MTLAFTLWEFLELDIFETSYSGGPPIQCYRQWDRNSFWVVSTSLRLLFCSATLEEGSLKRGGEIDANGPTLQGAPAKLARDSRD